MEIQINSWMLGNKASESFFWAVMEAARKRNVRARVDYRGFYVFDGLLEASLVERVMVQDRRFCCC